jgi:hypothetical protein
VRTSSVHGGQEAAAHQDEEREARDQLIQACRPAAPASTVRSGAR